jgi:hypothetical protein
MRIVARDDSGAPGGWLAVSEPVDAQPPRTLGSLLRLLLATAAVVVFVIGPGLAIRQSRRARLFSGLPLPGLGILLALGLLAWTMRPAWSVPFLKLSLIVVLAWVVSRTWRGRVWAELTPAEWRTLVVTSVVFVLGVSRAGMSVGPPDELYRGTVSRTLESGDRSDSRIQYGVVQLSLLHQSIRTSLARDLFAPYSFSSRGPLAGLIAVPLVGASGAHVSSRYPNETWALFDDQGFAVFRITCMALAALALLGGFGWVEVLAGPRRALLATTLLAGCPFFIHEVYFTWPKLLSAYFALLALRSVTTGRGFRGGLWLGVGYLAHPGALFAAPIALALVLLRVASSPEHMGWFAVLRRPVLYSQSVQVAAGIGLAVLLWRVVNLGQVEQGQFVGYLLMAYARRAASFHEWLALRLESLSNTVIPLAAYYTTPKPGTPEAGFHRFMYQYWLSLPFSVGLTAVPAFVWALLRFARSFSAAFFLILVVPFLLFTAYWGATDAGMMREGLQAWLCVLVGLVAIGWPGPGTVACVLGRLLLLRAVEILAMLLWPLALARPAGLVPYGLTDALFAGLITLLTLYLSFETWRELRAGPGAEVARSGPLPSMA